jgi:malate dehydrogenase (oxaloacetate-decarboxylating)
MFTQLVPSLLHCCHCRENEDGVGDQLPFETVSVWPTTAEPLTDGRTEFVGPFAPLTGSVAAEVADALPSALAAVTVTRRAWPTSALPTEYVCEVAPLMSPHERPSDAHRCHWYVNEVGLFDHVPLFAVSFSPDFAVPLIVGDDVLDGAAALATAAKMPVAAATSAATTASFHLFIGSAPSGFAFLEGVVAEMCGSRTPWQAIYGSFTLGKDPVSHYSASYSVVLRVRLDDRPGTFADLARAIADAGGLLGAIDLVRVESGSKVRDVSVLATDVAHAEAIVRAAGGIDGVEVENVSDRTFLMHLGGKIHMDANAPVKTRDDLSMAYTPGVARVCQAIADDPDAAWNLTIKRNTVAVVTDGSAVLGLGDIGAAAAMPVMEGKALLFKEFGGVDAWPVCLDTKDTDEIVRAVELLAPGFGGINLEDIAAPRCFEIEERLRASLDIPVFHDDQHGTAVVVLAALINALRVVGKEMSEIKVVLTGVGAAGVAVTRILMAAGVRNVVGCDRGGAVYGGRAGLDPVKARYAEETNPDDFRGSANEALAGADVYLGLSQPGAVSAEAVRTMAGDAIVFAMANPTPEVLPAEIAGAAAVIATGRSDYPNQINNVLAFPGIFRGALDVRASTITDGMEVAAGHAIAAVIAPEELSADYIIPSVFNRAVVPAVAGAVARAAETDGVARRALPVSAEVTS